jgi:uncharacterized repeat protein (TIGR01451 family)
MSSMLWKSGAIIGVIGIGSGVVFQAQKNLNKAPQQAQQSPENFGSVDDPLQLPDEDDPLAPQSETPASETLADSQAQGNPSFPPREEEPADDDTSSKKAFQSYLAAMNSTSPAAAEAGEESTANPFGGEPAVASADATIPEEPRKLPEVKQAAAMQVVEDDDPWGVAPAENSFSTEQAEPASDSASTSDATNPFAMIAEEDADPAASETSEGAAAPAGGLQHLAPGNSGPILLAAPNLEEIAGAEKKAPTNNDEEKEGTDGVALTGASEEPATEDAEPAPNPFSTFRSLPTEPESTAEASSPAINPFLQSAPSAEDDVPATVEAPASMPRTSIPPMENRHTDPEDLTGSALRSSIPRRGSEPAVASPGDAGLKSPTPPSLPAVADQLVPEEEETEARLELGGPTLDGGLAAPENPFGTEDAVEQTSGTLDEGSHPEPADQKPPVLRSSIPLGASIPPATNTQPAATETLPTVRSSIPAANEAATPPRTLPGLEVNPAPSRGSAVNPDPAPAPAPSKGPDLVGNGIIDRDVAQGPAQPQLTITKQAPAEAVIGQTLEYSILVKNIGRSPAYNVVVEDQIPKGTECTGTAPKCETENKKLIWKLGALEAGQEQTLRVRVIPTDAGEIGSIATVSFSAEVAARTKIVEPTAKLTVSGPQEIIAGQSGQYRLVISNNGPVDLSGLWVRTKLPEGLNHTGGRDLEYELGDLPRGQSRDVSLALQGETPGAWHYDVSITRDDRELARAATDVSVITSRLTISRTGPTKRFVGRPATYSNTVTNTSNKTLTGITVSEVLPPGVELGRNPQNGVWDPARRTVTWTIPQLPAGAELALPLTIVPRSPGTLDGKITAADSTGNRAEVATTLDVAGFSSLAVDMEHDGKPIAVGEQVSVRFTVKNSGTAPAEQVQAMFELPEEVQFVNAQGPAGFERIGNLITFNAVAGIPVNDSLQYDVVMQATKATPPEGERIRVSLSSTQLPEDNPLVQQQQIVIFGEDSADSKTVLQASGTR